MLFRHVQRKKLREENEALKRENFYFKARNYEPESLTFTRTQSNNRVENLIKKLQDQQGLSFLRMKSSKRKHSDFTNH